MRTRGHAASGQWRGCAAKNLATSCGPWAGVIECDAQYEKALQDRSELFCGALQLWSGDTRPDED